MELDGKIRSKLRGSAEEQSCREELLRTILRTMQEGGSEAVTAAMKSRLDAMERELKEKLDALKRTL